MQISHIVGTGVMIGTLVCNFAYGQSSSTDAMTSKASTAYRNTAMHAENRRTSKAVRRALTAKKGLVSANIAILTKGDVITLVGSVPDASQISLAESAAKGVPQVHAVDNRLVVEGEEGGG